MRRTGRAPRNEAEAEVFSSFPNPIGDDCEFFLHLLRHFDTDFRWYVVAANDDEERMARVLFDPQTLPGFSDSGAHLTNMAYYDSNLRGLQIAQRDSIDRVAARLGFTPDRYVRESYRELQRRLAPAGTTPGDMLME